MGRKRSEGPTGAIVGGGGTTPLYGNSPVHNTPGYGSPKPGHGSPSPKSSYASPVAKPYVGPPAYAPDGPAYAPSAPPYGGPAYASTNYVDEEPPKYVDEEAPKYVDQEAPTYVDQEAGPPLEKPRIKQNRKCRDIVFLILFFAYGIGIIIESSFGFSKGSPRRYILLTSVRSHIFWRLYCSEIVALEQTNSTSLIDVFLDAFVACEFRIFRRLSSEFCKGISNVLGLRTIRGKRSREHILSLRRWTCSETRVHYLRVSLRCLQEFQMWWVSNLLEAREIRNHIQSFRRWMCSESRGHYICFTSRCIEDRDRNSFRILE